MLLWPTQPGFALRGTLGTPEEAASTLLTTVIAPPGSGSSATLVSSGEEIRGKMQPSDGGVVYTIEYILTRVDGRRVRNLSVVMFIFPLIANENRRDVLMPMSTVWSVLNRWQVGDGSSSHSLWLPQSLSGPRGGLSQKEKNRFFGSWQHHSRSYDQDTRIAPWVAPLNYG